MPLTRRGISCSHWTCCAPASTARAGDGFRLRLDGPVSLLRHSQRYGVRLAAKLDKLHRADRADLLVAVSERLNVSREQVASLPGPVLWFKGRLDPKQVLDAL